MTAERRIEIYGLAVRICLDLHHPLRETIPGVDDARDSDEVAQILVAYYQPLRAV